jgi:transposase
MPELIAARDWLRVFQLPAYASELNQVESAWSLLKGPWPTWSSAASAS